MAERKKQPELRFKGFSGDWEERKLGELVDVYDGTHQTPNYTDSGVMFLSVENIKTLHSKKCISKEAFENEFKIFPEAGDVLMTRIGDIGTANVVESNDHKAYYVSLALLKQKILDPYFLKESIHSESVKRELWHRTLHIAFPKKINKNEITKVPMNYPDNTEEQRSIGTFFKAIDNLITLQQRKLDKLIHIKKALLDKMFPKNGAVVPEIRFKGFREDWEEQELGDLLQIKDSARIPNEQWVETGIRYLRSSDLENKGQDGALFISSEAYEAYKSKTGAPERGDVLFNSGGNIGLSLLKTDNAPIYVQGGAILYIRTSQSKDVDGSYLNIYFSTARMKKYIDIASAGGTMQHFTLKPANAAPFIYPNIIEQKKIGEFFNHHDNLITLHQLKLEKLKNIKKACLEKMFV